MERPMSASGAPEWMTAEHSMGTSIMAVAFDGGVVLGADSRTTTGTYIANRVSDKITPMTDSIFCCRSGSAADTQAISDYVRYYLDMHVVEMGTPPLVKTAARLFRELCYSNKTQLMAGMICAGWDSAKGGQVFCVPIGGSLVEQPFAIGGSGSTYIYGYCDAHYKEGMTKEECQAFVKNAVALAMSRDGSSGGVIRMVTVDKDGTDRTCFGGEQVPSF
ncbi:hypothetical protein BU14_0537s0010 [Porphyra umbilicalis]|uniref:Proteasome subunit beta n=1 Tax=Porphyra umbilicalis TaxID=2786 RepID=A0A1X6NS30_PORUM|nr:hypothetical protein BU14_0537s0010 [Porphyra umbilicalis]|eukprot:OSX71402.1 hypothetical protein BU14_0537s0010 [Porphyra umbilicalis]